MPGNLWLGAAQNLHEVADAHLLLSHQIEQPEARRITESLKKLRQIEPFVDHTSYIRVDEYECNEYIHLDEYVRGDAWQRFLIPSGRSMARSQRARFPATMQV